MAHSIGAFIKEKRLALGLSQDELAKLAGFKGRSAICMLEDGTRRITQRKVRPLCEALKITPGQLFGWDDRDAAVNELARTDEGLSELVNIFRSLPMKKKIRLLSFAYALQDELEEEKNGKKE